MKFIPQSIPDVVLIKLNTHNDDRGYFVETFRQDLLEDAVGYKVNFMQDNESKSSKGTLRGLHYQITPFAQTKLVRVIKGSVLDIAIDIRKSSPSFGHHVSVELTEQNKHQLFVPHGFAHGFVVLSESATFSYKVDNYYAPEYDRGIAFNDEKLKINWQLPFEELKLSDRDKIHPPLANARDLFN
ncbi:dTDP-4-dehydrorhamnose 3,5-epimerase [Candidatus Pelagibacter sp. Uisw_090]|jgi:dTDP-4-dehydrorhamnose 3,5-epimerase|uniref:dTDP-4-dehydrorhamnose 3,5-epimerase n=1 Tax=Candidatus Pelagibacter sp. Uisw_090 TaxID=3230993 RepID=UPI0039E73EAB